MNLNCTHFYTFSNLYSIILTIVQVVLESESHKKEQEWRISCTVDDVDKSSEFDPFHVGAYCKPIFEYMLTLEVIINTNKLIILLIFVYCCIF